MFMCLHQHRDLLAFHCFSVLVHVVHYSRSCPVITTNRWNLSNAAPPFFMLLFLFRCRCVQVLSQSPANRDCKGGAGTGGGAGVRPPAVQLVNNMLGTSQSPHRAKGSMLQ